MAGLSRPMSIHEKKIDVSIDLNIIGTANIVKICQRKKIKLIYLSTNYVYPGNKGNYREDSPLNHLTIMHGQSLVVKLVFIYTKILILRVCMTDYPFTHKKAIKGAKSSFIFNKFVSSMIPILIKEKGILNVGVKKEIYMIS